jgi:LacI family transcriptional regulator
MNLRIGLRIETDSSYGRGLLEGIGAFARKHGPWLLSLGAERTRGLDGILALVRSPREAARLRASGVPFVDLDNALSVRETPWRVAIDEGEVAALAARHFQERALRHAAFVGWERGGARRPRWEVQRELAFRRAFPGARSFRGRDLGSWLAALPRPCGILASNDARAKIVSEAIRERGFRIPEDFALLGVDDDPVLCELSDPPLSSIELDTRRLGYEGAALLDRRLRRFRGASTPTRIGPLRLVVRRSTDRFAVEDPAVAAALRQLHARLHQPIRVPDLVLAAGLSRRSLELRFRASVGRTPGAELRRARVYRAVDLLRSTNWPLKRISAASGFPTQEAFHAVFRAALGTTPGRFRTELGFRPMNNIEPADR